MSPSVQTVVLDVEGMKCGGCVRAVETTLLDQPGVQRADVNLVSRSAWLDLTAGESDVDGVLKALADRGFPAKERSLDAPIGAVADGQALPGWWQQWRQLMVALVLLLLSVLGHLSEAGHLSLPLIGSLPFHATLATVALLGPGRPILVGGIAAARAGAPSMDSLVGLGVSSAYVASLVALVWPQVGWPCFFNEPVMLLGFVLLGRFLEERARFRTGQALHQLAELQPDTARLLLSDGEIREVRVGALRPGETVQLLAGDRIPVDGVVLEGASAVDVSSLTGEPLPLQADPGTELSSGSLNLESTLVMKVTRVGAETALARIIRLVEQAQARRAPIQGLADRVAGRFCYCVIGLALATFLFWWLFGAEHWPEVLQASAPGMPMTHEMHHGGLGSGASTPMGLALQLSIAVLVVACPCALGLATPTVITVATGLAARRGWLFRGGDVIETAARLEHMVFDKTGTLTLGRPLVTDVYGDDPDNLLQLAASLEQSSRHPLAYALLQEAQRRELALWECEDVRTVSGQGLEGHVNCASARVRVGKPDWLEGQGVAIAPAAQDWLSAAEGSVVAVAVGAVLVGLVQIEDQLRPDVAPALQRLRSHGLALSVFSGDRQVAVQRLGKQLGFAGKDLGWQMLPEQKLQRLEQLRQAGRVAMVGDGINDAPALAAADLGIAIGTGTQIAQDSAGLVLLGDRLDNLPEALSLARRTLVKVRQNLFWAFGYNLIVLPVAAGALLPSYGVLLSPPLAALLMALSSITVVFNALALRMP